MNKIIIITSALLLTACATTPPPKTALDHFNHTKSVINVAKANYEVCQDKHANDESVVIVDNEVLAPTHSTKRLELLSNSQRITERQKRAVIAAEGFIWHCMTERVATIETVLPPLASTVKTQWQARQEITASLLNRTITIGQYNKQMGDWQANMAQAWQAVVDQYANQMRSQYAADQDMAARKHALALQEQALSQQAYQHQQTLQHQRSMQINQMMLNPPFMHQPSRTIRTECERSFNGSMNCTSR